MGCSAARGKRGRSAPSLVQPAPSGGGLSAQTPLPAHGSPSALGAQLAASSIYCMYGPPLKKLFIQEKQTNKPQT